MRRKLRHGGFALALAAVPLFAEGPAEWRFWNAADGLTESYSRVLSQGPAGELWVRHGTVSSMSVLDGYGVRRIPEPRLGEATDFSRMRRVWTGPDGAAWTVEEGVLKRFTSGRWTTEAPQPGGSPMISAVPSHAGAVLVLFGDRIAEFTPATRAWTTVKESSATRIGPFRSMVRDDSGRIWIAGAGGLGSIETGAEGDRWSEYGTARIGLRDLEYPLPGAPGEVFVSGRLASKRSAVARCHDAKIEIVYAGSGRSLRGWRGPDGHVWILEDNVLARIVNGRKEKIEQRGRLSSVVYDVITEPGGGFWLGTADGLAHLGKAVWETPEAVLDFDRPVHAIAEDRRGRLWFAAATHLLELDGSRWSAHRLPEDMTTHVLQADGLCPLPDGRIVVKAYEHNQYDRLLLFDPATRRFSTVQHPEGRQIRFAGPRADGTVWVRTTPGFRLEIFDGRNFRPKLDLGSAWNGGNLKAVVESANGDIWFAGSTGAGLYHAGKYKAFGPADGFTDNGAFTVAEPSPGRILAGGRNDLLEYKNGRWHVTYTGLDRARSIIRARDGILWLACGTGIYSFQHGSWIPKSEEEGLPSSVGHKVFQDSRGRIWAGTSRGLSLFHREADTDAPETAMRIAGNAAEGTSDGTMRVLFAGVDKWKQTLSERLMYSYSLDGRPWTPFAPVNSVTLSGLSRGGHRLQVRAMDRNGNAERTPDTLEFSIPWPWYRQTAFLLIAVGAGFCLVLLVGIATNQYRQRGQLIVELDRARRAAEAASRHKSEFLANMSHEIRTPMNAIMGMTRMALESPPGPEQQECLRTVSSSASSLLTVLNDILDLSKVEAGKLELATADFTLRDCVEAAVRTFRLRAAEKGLALRSRIDEAVPLFLSGDEHRLRQILINLIGNAVKFTDTGEVNVEVFREPGAGEGALHFVVTDTGVGIPADKQSLVFAAFEQVDGSSTRKHGGTGLGLAISAKLADRMGGRIWVESPWQGVPGCAFHFTAKFAIGAAPAPAADDAAGRAPVPLRILLAEDNPVNQRLAVRMLEKHGHTVLVAAEGAEAVAVFERERPDLVLMDVQMPGVDGFEATARIRALEAWTGRRIPIVALTAHALDGDRERCLQAGMDAYVSKPIDFDELARVIASLAGGPEPGQGV